MFKNFLTKLKFKYQLIRYQFLDVPTFVSIYERVSLHKRAKELYEMKTKEKLLIGEFGPFLGGTTIALAEGLNACSKTKEDWEIHTYDSFEMRPNTNFFDLSLKLLKQYKFSINDLEKIDENTYSFENLFKKISKNYKNIKAHKLLFKSNKDVNDLSINKNVFDLVHFDLPKEMDIGIKIFKSLENKCSKNVIFIFQDFGYKWSFELISYVGILLKNGAKIEKMVGPSLYLYIVNSDKVLKKVNEEYCKNKNNYESLIYAIKESELYADNDRIPELFLAKCLYEKNILKNKFLFKETISKLEKKSDLILSRKFVLSILEVFKEDFTLEKSI